MAKKSRATAAETKAEEPKEKVWAFPNRSRCPRCETTDTTAIASHDGVQTRRCERAVCRWIYKVIGTLI